MKKRPLSRFLPLLAALLLLQMIFPASATQETESGQPFEYRACHVVSPPVLLPMGTSVVKVSISGRIEDSTVHIDRCEATLSQGIHTESYTLDASCSLQPDQTITYDVTGEILFLWEAVSVSAHNLGISGSFDPADYIIQPEVSIMTQNEMAAALAILPYQLLALFWSGLRLALVGLAVLALIKYLRTR